jgi:glycerophosphoryl diester phosphodiesterase
MFIQLKTPVIIGHRGDSTYAPENTLAAFDLALKHQADAIEFDVKLTADKHVVVIHDQSVNRTTNGRGLISNLTLEEIKKLDAGSWFDPKYKDERVPTLEEVFDCFGSKIPMNVELTNYMTPWDELVELVVDLVREKKLEDQVFFSSFYSVNLVKARKALPACGIGYLKYSGIIGILQRLFQPFPEHISSLEPSYTDVHPGMVEWEHSSGRRVLVYTVNDPETMKHLFQIGVDGIFTDDPLMGKKIALEYTQGKMVDR